MRVRIGTGAGVKMGLKIPQPNENPNMRGRYRPWRVAMVIMSTTCALLPCRRGLTEEQDATSVKSSGKRPNVVLLMADDIGRRLTRSDCKLLVFKGFRALWASLKNSEIAPNYPSLGCSWCKLHQAGDDVRSG